jgi:crotonobetainyl-CoA:carnitine CoA-transferase CaiB-like acyl-CoA transferase
VNRRRCFGEVGPGAHLPGFDVTAYWARSGLMEMTRQPDAPSATGAFGAGDHRRRSASTRGIMTACPSLVAAFGADKAIVDESAARAALTEVTTE